MGEHSQKAFTADKLKKFAASGGPPEGKGRDRDASALTDDYGRKAARSSDSSAFALGGAAKAPSLGRAGRAGGGRVNRAEGGKAYGPQQDPDWRDWHDDPQGHTTASGGRLTPFEKFSVGKWDKSSIDPRNWGSESPDPNAPSRAKGGRVDRAHGGRTKSKGKAKTVVNVIVGGRGEQQPPPQMPLPPPPPPRLPPPPPPQAATGPVGPPGGMPPGGPPGMPPGGPPMPPGGPPGMPPRGLPPGMLPPGMMPPGRASGGRVSEKYGSGSGQGRMEKTRRQGHGKTELAE